MPKVKEAAEATAAAGKKIVERVKSTRAYQIIEAAQYDPPTMKLTTWLKICGIIGVAMLVAMLFIRWDAKKKALVEFEAARKVAVAKAISEIEAKNRVLLDKISRLESDVAAAETLVKAVDKEAAERIASLTAVKSACAVDGKSDIERINAVIKEANR